MIRCINLHTALMLFSWSLVSSFSRYISLNLISPTMVCPSELAAAFYPSCMFAYRRSRVLLSLPTSRVQSRLIRVKSPLMVMKASGCLHRRSATVTCIMSHAAAPADVVKDSYSGKEYGQILSVKSSMSSEQRHSFTVTCPGSFIN